MLCYVDALQYMSAINEQVNEKSCRLRMATYRDGLKRKGGNIGMGL